MNFPRDKVTLLYRQKQASGWVILQSVLRVNGEGPREVHSEQWCAYRGVAKEPHPTANARPLGVNFLQRLVAYNQSVITGADSSESVLDASLWLDVGFGMKD